VTHSVTTSLRVARCLKLHTSWLARPYFPVFLRCMGHDLSKYTVPCIFDMWGWSSGLEAIIYDKQHFCLLYRFWMLFMYVLKCLNYQATTNF